MKGQGGFRLVWTPERLAACEALAMQGKSSREIAEQLGTTRKAIMSICKRKGIDLMASPGHPNSSVTAEGNYRTTRVWERDEEDKRRTFARKAARGAREALKALHRGTTFEQVGAPAARVVEDVRSKMQEQE